MIAVVHGPRGCGKSTALHAWLTRRGWMPPRGFRTFFGGPDNTLRIASWADGAPTIAITGKPRVSAPFPPSSPPCPLPAWDPAFAPSLYSFLDDVFFPSTEERPKVPLHIHPPLQSSLPPLSTPRFPWVFDAPAFWRVVLASLGSDSARPLVVDELGVFETLPGCLDSDALHNLLHAIQSAPRAILVIQDRALPFWLRALAGEEGALPG